MKTDLPRLGSWVRIPSPAPRFFNIDIELRATLRGRCCFPASPVKAGEAWGKRRKAIIALLPRSITGVHRPAIIMRMVHYNWLEAFTSHRTPS